MKKRYGFTIWEENKHHFEIEAESEKEAEEIMLESEEKWEFLKGSTDWDCNLPIIE